MSEERKEQTNKSEQLEQALATKPLFQGASSDTKKNNKIFGVVKNCGQLRVREEPNEDATVIATLPVDTTVELLDDEVDNGFYAVFAKTADGIEFDGYCMAEFIQVTRPEKE